MTCYYYRGAYYKAFWADPPSCAVGEPRKKYLGESSLPLILQNFHRYFLFCVSNTDSVTPPARTLRYAGTAPQGEIKTYDAGHFDFYLGDPFEALVRDQIEFLTRHLVPAFATSRG